MVRDSFHRFAAWQVSVLRTFWITLVAMGTLCVTTAAHSGPAYIAVDLGSNTTGTAINNAGTVVGSITTNGNSFAFSFRNGQLNTIHIPALQGYTTASGINNSGIIVGEGYVNPNTFAQPYDTFIYSNGAITVVSTAGGTTSCIGINDSNILTGPYALDFGNFFYDSYYYSNGTFVSIGTFEPATVTASTAINNAGVIVGYFFGPDRSPRTYGAFYYSNGMYSYLGTLPGANQSQANGINNVGTVVGFCDSPSGTNHAFSYSNGNMADLGTLGGLVSIANAINDAGVAVGNSTASSGEQRAFVFSNGTMTDLNSNLVQQISTTLNNAVAINRSGQIVANGENGDAFLLTPTPLLSIKLQIPDTAIVSWPSPSPGFVLQQNLALVGSVWTNWTGMVQDDGTNRSVEISPATGNSYFRLIYLSQ